MKAALGLTVFACLGLCLPSGIAGQPNADAQKHLLGRAAFIGELLRHFADSDIPIIRNTVRLAYRPIWDASIKQDLLDLLQAEEAEIRHQAAENLGQGAAAGDKDIHDTLVLSLNEGNPKARGAIYRAIGRINAEGAADVLVNALTFDDAQDKQLRADLILAIDATGKAGVNGLLILADSGSRKDLEHVLDVYPALRSRAAGEGLAALVKNYHVTPAQRVKLIRSFPLADLVDLKGDPQRGLSVFRQNKVVACASCHRMNAIGENIGPDLNRLWSTHTTAAILDVLLARGKKEKGSYHDIAQHLPVGEILDLTAFLRDRKAQEVLHGYVRVFAAVGPFDGIAKSEHGPEVDADSNRRYDPQTGKAVEGETGLAWKLRKAGSDGIVDLAPLFRGKSISAYAKAFIQSPTDQQAVLHVEGSAVARYWVNGNKVLDFAPCCGAEPTPVNLRRGWNTILVRVFAAQDDLAFGLRITGADGLRFASVKD